MVMYNKKHRHRTVRKSENIGENKPTTREPVASHATIAEIVCLSNITRAYIVANSTGITNKPSHTLYRLIMKYAEAPANVQ